MTELRFIPLYKVRTFSEKLNDTFEFIRQNWRLLLKYLTYMVLPVALMGGLCQDALMKNSFDAVASNDLDSAFTFLAKMGGYFACYMLAALLATLICYSVMRLYQQRKGDLQDIGWPEMRHEMWVNFKRMFIANLAITFMMMLALGVMVLLSAATMWFLLVTLPAFVAFVLTLTYVVPIYVFEERTLTESIADSMRIASKTMGGIIGVAIVMGILTSILSTFIAIPYYIIIMVRAAMLSSAESAASNPLVEILGFVFSVFSIMGSLAASMTMIFAMNFQYGHALDKEYGYSVEDDIKEFEEL